MLASLETFAVEFLSLLIDYEFVVDFMNFKVMSVSM